MRKLEQFLEEKPLLFMACFAAVYWVWFTLLEKYADPIVTIHTRLDDMIPFCRYFIIPYDLWFLYIGVSFLWMILFDRKNLINMERYMFAGMITALVIYTFIPNGLDIRPSSLGDVFFSQLIAKLYASDTATNVCPSLHVFNSIASNTIIWKSDTFRHRKAVRAGSLTLIILIILATMMIKQHSIIDVVCGILMAAVLYPLSYKPVFIGETDSRWHIRNNKI